MRICPKCSAKYGDDLNFCQNCSTMLQTVVEEPPSPPKSEPALPAKEEPAAKSPAIPKQPLLRCPRCGSGKIIPNTPIRDRNEGSNQSLSAFVDAEPNALIFKERQYSTLLGDICGECGHVELKAQDYRSLYRHYMQSRNKTV